MKKLLLISLFLLAFLERTVFDLGPNFELVTTALLLTSCYLGRKQSFTLVALIMITTDMVLGNTNIFIFTWTGFLIPALFASNIFKLLRINKIILGTTLGIASNMFFYLWTNFGVWALDSWGMYSNDINGLITSYVNGLPFLRMQLTSTLIFVPAGFLLTKLAIYTCKILQQQARMTSQSLV